MWGTSDYAANLLGALAVGLTDRVTAAMTEASGLDPSAVAALLVVAERPGQPIEHLRASLNLTHSGAVRLADRLQGAGLLRRGPGPDRRSRGLELTAAGHEHAGLVRRARHHALVEVLEVLGRQEQRSLSELLSALLHRLPHTQQDAWRICRYCTHAICRDGDCPVGSAVR